MVRVITEGGSDIDGGMIVNRRTTPSVKAKDVSIWSVKQVYKRRV
jgi:hypothetical protein